MLVEENPECHSSEELLLSYVQGVGLPLPLPLPMHWPLPPWALGRALTRARLPLMPCRHLDWLSSTHGRTLGSASTRASSLMPMAVSCPIHRIPSGVPMTLAIMASTRVGLGQSLSCLHSTHSRSRSMITAIL